MHYLVVSQKNFDYNVDMILSQKQTIEDLVIEVLAKDPYQTGPELVASIENIRKNTTKQAVYYILKPLLENEVIAKVGSRYYVSKLWVDRLTDLLEINSQNFDGESAFSLKEGESMTYRFPSLLTCDTYWAHLFNLMVKWLPRNRPFFFWLPHEWLILGRHKEELEIFKLIKEQQKMGYYVISGKTDLDKDFKKKFTSDFLRVNIGNDLSLKQNYYLNVFDDYIIEVFLHKKLSEKIEIFYQNHLKISPENIFEFENLIKEKFPVRMKISKNKKRATKLRKQLAKDFFVPGEYEI